MGKRVIVVGAGAAGLMAGIWAARSGAEVTIVEAMEKPGRKLLITGSGRCNLTNMDSALAESYYSYDARSQDNHSDFAGSVIREFDAVKVRAFFGELGLLTIEKNGYVYPYTGQASSVLEVLLAEVRRLHIKIKCRERIVGIVRKGDGFAVQTETWQYDADRVILCCGSKAVPTTGSDGSGYRLAAGQNLAMTPVVPALTALTSKESFLSKVAGVRAHAKLTLYQENRCIGCETGEIQWTAQAISGIAAFILSRFVSTAEETDGFHAEVDFFPDYEKQALVELLLKRAQELKKESPAVLLRGLLNEKLTGVILKRAGIRKDTCEMLEQEEIRRLLEVCMHFVVSIQGTNSFDTCQVCAGGIALSELDPDTLECKKCRGLYVAGELADIDGPCGGYNLQWAWSSGYLAGCMAAKEKK